MAEHQTTRAGKVEPDPPSGTKRRWGKTFSICLSIVSGLAAVITIGTFDLVPRLRGVVDRVVKRDLTDVDRADLRAWVREASRDGATNDRERAELEKLVASARLRDDEVRAFVDKTEESIQASAELVRQGAELVRRGEFLQACDRFLLATSADPENGQGWVNLGAAKLELGLLDDAETALRRAVELKPDRWTAHYNLAASLAATGSSEQALQHLQKALDLASKAGLSEAEKRSLRTDLAANRWLTPLSQMPRFEALLRHPVLETAEDLT